MTEFEKLIQEEQSYILECMQVARDLDFITRNPSQVIRGMSCEQFVKYHTNIMNNDENNKRRQRAIIEKVRTLGDKELIYVENLANEVQKFSTDLLGFY